jgi:hypothetical protein
MICGACRFCPANVYEYKEGAGGKPELIINAQNCVHCKCCRSVAGCLWGYHASLVGGPEADVSFCVSCAAVPRDVAVSRCPKSTSTGRCRRAAAALPTHSCRLHLVQQAALLGA